ncbi:hypothetical protein D3C76_308210 [compost metagenome]
MNSSLTDRNKAKFFNQRVAKCAFLEAFGSTEKVLNQAWGERIVRRREAPLGPALIQSSLIDAIKVGIHWKWMDLFGIPASVRKELYGGRKIQVVNSDFEKLSTVAIVYNEKAQTQMLFGLTYKEL